MRLPVHDVLDELRAALAEGTSAVLVAPPGAGKTTVTPLALMDTRWAAGKKLVVLEPRRLAARAAAERMASTLGQPVGETVGFRVRMESRVSARTRVEVVTEGVFTRMILDDPALEGVAGVLFDEFHERSLDADLGLAFAVDSRRILNPDLRILVMSATLEGARIARFLDNAPIIESHGRMHPVETRYVGRGAGVVEQVVRTVLQAVRQEHGSMLVFLPGQAEIQRTAERLRETLRAPDVDVVPLFGALDPRDQDRAIAPAPKGRRKVVLATSIAETSLTIEGVRVVIDSGLARTPRFDPASGLTRLATIRASQASAEQRRGRAGRTEPGVCYRLWDEPETRALPPFGRAEILETDLSRLALDLARWGARSPADLAFLDPPPGPAFAEARALLRRLRALDGEGALTPHGRAMSELPLPPRLAHMVLRGAASGQASRAARIALLLVERGLGGRSADLAVRLDVLAQERSPRVRDALALARRWETLAGPSTPGAEPVDDGLLLAEAFPERIAKSRGRPGEYQLAGGRGVTLDPSESLAREAWLAVAELGGGEARDRVLLAARLDPATLRHAFRDRMTVEERLEAAPGGRLRAKESLRLGRLVVEEKLIDDPDPTLIAAALLDEVRRGGLGVLPWSEGAKSLRARVAFLRAADPAWPDLSDEALMARLDEWLYPLVAGRTSLRQVGAGPLEAALLALVPWPLQRTLAMKAPARWTAPTGNSFAIDYAAEGGPRVEVRVQEVFGLSAHPTVGEQTPLTLALLSPAHRPIQLTRDLPGFWKGSWSDVRKDMRGRYPKHPWPEDPSTATPTTRTRPRPLSR